VKPLKHFAINLLTFVKISVKFKKGNGHTKIDFLEKIKVENGFYRLDTNHHTFLFQIKTKYKKTYMITSTKFKPEILLPRCFYLKDFQKNLQIVAFG
jgi:hypothetical protein